MMEQITLFNCRPVIVLKVRGVDSLVIKRIKGLFCVLMYNYIVLFMRFWKDRQNVCCKKACLLI